MKTNNISGILLAAKNYLNKDDNIHKSKAKEIKWTGNYTKEEILIKYVVKKLKYPLQFTNLFRLEYGNALLFTRIEE